MEDIQADNGEPIESHLLPPDVAFDDDIDLDEEDEQPVKLGPVIARQEGVFEKIGKNGSNMNEADIIPLDEEKSEETKPEEVTIEGRTYLAVQEGLAKILVPKDAKDQNVFYNPIQQFNRDLTVAVLKGFGELCQEEHAKKKAKSNAWLEKRYGKKNGKGSSGGEASVNGDAEAAVAKPDVKSEGAAPRANGKEEPKMRFRVLDALSATGLRALRYAMELPFATEIVANDMSTNAVASIDRNIAYNNVSRKVHSSTANAIAYMYNAAFSPNPDEEQPKHPRKLRRPPPNRNRFQVIDLDPFGTAVPFLDAAIQALDDGGLLCVTCTDAGVFAATGYAEKCFSLYGGLPIKGDHCHEGGIRLIIHAIGSSAAKYGVCIEPLLSLSIDYYVRIFVRVRRRPESVKLWASSNMMVYTCDDGCGSWRIQRLGTAKEREEKKKDKDGNDPNPGAPHIYKFGIARSDTGSSQCEFCGTRMHVAGPMYSGALHSKEFLEHLLWNILPDMSAATYGTVRRMSGMLQTALSELTPYPTADLSQPHHPTTTTHDLEPPHFFILPTRLSKTLHCQAPSLPYLRSALLSLNHTAVRSHCRAGSIKTSAPWNVVWAIMRSWVKRHPIREDNIRDDSVAWKILKRQRQADDDEPMADADASNPKEAEDAEEEEELIKGIVWDENVGKEENYYGKGAHSGSGKILRYQANPTPNWGPQARPENNKKKNKEQQPKTRERFDPRINEDGTITQGMTRKQRKMEKRKNKVNKKAFRKNNEPKPEDNTNTNGNIGDSNGTPTNAGDIPSEESNSRKRKTPDIDEGKGGGDEPNSDAIAKDTMEIDAEENASKKQKVGAA